MGVWGADYGEVFGGEVEEVGWTLGSSFAGRDVDLPVRERGEAAHVGDGRWCYGMGELNMPGKVEEDGILLR